MLISTTTLKNHEKQLKDLKSEHSNCSEEIGKLKRMNALLRKENERITKETIQNTTELKVFFKQKTHEQAFPMAVDNFIKYQPKKTLSLLNKN